MGNFSVRRLPVSVIRAEDPSVGKHRRVMIQDVVLVIGGHSAMNRFVQIPVTAVMSGQVDAFSHRHSIYSHLGRCPLEKGFGHQSSVAMQLRVPVKPVAHVAGLIFGNPDAALRQAVLHEAVRSDFRTKLRHTFFLGTLFS